MDFFLHFRCLSMKAPDRYVAKSLALCLFVRIRLRSDTFGRVRHLERSARRQRVKPGRPHDEPTHPRHRNIKHSIIFQSKLLIIVCYFKCFYFAHSIVKVCPFHDTVIWIDSITFYCFIGHFLLVLIDCTCSVVCFILLLYVLQNEKLWVIVSYRCFASRFYPYYNLLMTVESQMNHR